MLSIQRFRVILTDVYLRRRIIFTRSRSSQLLESEVYNIELISIVHKIARYICNLGIGTAVKCVAAVLPFTPNCAPELVEG